MNIEDVKCRMSFRAKRLIAFISSTKRSGVYLLLTPFNSTNYNL